MIETVVSTHILDNIHIPKYNPDNELYKNIVRLSMKAHDLAKEIIEASKKDLINEPSFLALFSGKFL